MSKYTNLGNHVFASDDYMICFAAVCTFRRCGPTCWIFFLIFAVISFVQGCNPIIEHDQNKYWRSQYGKYESCLHFWFLMYYYSLIQGGDVFGFYVLLDLQENTLILSLLTFWSLMKLHKFEKISDARCIILTLRSCGGLCKIKQCVPH